MEKQGLVQLSSLMSNFAGTSDNAFSLETFLGLGIGVTRARAWFNTSTDGRGVVVVGG